MSIKQLNIGKPVEERLSNIETQVDLHTSLMESEQGTRMRANSELHKRFDAQDTRLVRLERIAWGMGGALVALKLLPELVNLIKNQ